MARILATRMMDLGVVTITAQIHKIRRFNYHLSFRTCGLDRLFIGRQLSGYPFFSRIGIDEIEKVLPLPPRVVNPRCNGGCCPESFVNTAKVVMKDV